MADVIPDYLANQQLVTSNRPRSPQIIADIGQGMEAQALAGVGNVIAQIGQELAAIEARKQLIRDSVTLSELKGRLDDFEFNSAPDPSRVQLVEDFKKQEDEYHRDWNRQAQILPHGMSRAVQDQFKIYTEVQRGQAKSKYREKSRPIEKQWVMADLQRQRAIQLKGNVTDPERAKKNLKHLVNSYSGYLTSTEVQSFLENVDSSVESFHIQLAISNAPEEAYELIANAKTLDQEQKNNLKNKVDAEIARRERERKLKLQEDREDTYRTIITNIWEGKLKDPQIVTALTEAGLIDIEDAKYARNLMLNPDPPEHKLTAEADVRQAIENIGTNSGTKQDAISVLYSNVQNLDPEKGASLLNSIFAAHDKNIAEIQRESRDIMEELIRDKDPLSGLFTDDERQILAHSEAYLMLDEEVKKAAQEEKPLTRRETLIKATQIGRQMKKKIKAEEEIDEEPSFEPDRITDEDFIATLSPERQAVYRSANQATKDKMLANLKRVEIGKRAISLKTGREFPKKTKKFPVPEFVMEGKEPELVFDSEGKELGLKTKDRGIWKIGNQGYISGKLYEYTGNGNWKAVK